MISLAEVFNDDGTSHKKLKSLFLKFHELKISSSQLFFAMKNSFPKVEKLEIHSKFPFSSEFLFLLTCNIGNIKSLTMSSFRVNNKYFDINVLDILKLLRKKLKFVKLTLRNIQNLSRHSVPVKNHLRQESCEQRDPSFSYTPLTRALADHFNVKLEIKGENKVYRQLELSAGKNIVI